MTDRRNSGQGVGDSQQGAVGRKPLEPNEGRIGYPIVKTIIPQALVFCSYFLQFSGLLLDQVH
jgi:hypothetical protein